MMSAWIALGLLAALLAAPFVLGVPALRRGVRLAAEPRLEPVRISQVEWADAGFFKRRARDFAQARFEPLGEFGIEPMAGNALLVAAFLSTDRRVCGLALQAANRRTHALVLQLVTHFPAGLSVTTSNNRFGEVFLYPARRVLFRHPRVQKLEDLLAHHAENLSHYGSLGTALPFASADVVPWIEVAARSEREEQARLGLEVREGDFYRLTLKGAARMAGKQWWHRVVGHWLE